MSLYKDASLVMIPSAYKDGKLYSIRPTDGDGDFTFSRGSNLAATRVDVNGLIEKGRENLVLHSNSFSTSPTWGKSGSTTLTSGQAGYDGSNDAWLVTDNGTSSYSLYQSWSGNGVYSLSVYAKAGTGDRFRLDFGGGTNNFLIVDLSDGSIISQNALIDNTITSAGNGWYRISLTANVSSAIYTRYGLAYDSGESTSQGTFYIQDAQAERGLVATDYIETGASTAQAGILEDMPRLDYSGGASCPALLLEPQRTNLIDNTEYFAGYDLLGNVSLTTNYGISPEGKQNASRITGLNGAGTNDVRKQLSLNCANKTLSFSVYLKGSGTLRQQISNGVDQAHTQTITLTSEWKRHTLTGTFNSTAVSITYLVLDDLGATATEYEIWGTQCEEGSYPTSYIPTYGASVTRSQDTTNSSGLDVSDFHTGEDFTMFVDLANNESLVRDGSDGGISIRKANQTAGSLRIYRASGSATTNWVVWFDDSSVQNPLPKRIEGDNPKVAIRRIYSTGEWKVFVNGVAVWTKYNTNYSPMANLKIWAGGSPQELKGVTLFDTALTDSECIALTE